MPRTAGYQFGEVGPSSTDLSMIKFANQFSRRARSALPVCMARKETEANNVASTFTFSCVRVEVRIQSDIGSK